MKIFRSVAEAIENVQFCPDVLISLFSMLRACLNRQKDVDCFLYTFLILIFTF